jgi:hypothetical protein
VFPIGAGAFAFESLAFHLNCALLVATGISLHAADEVPDASQLQVRKSLSPNKCIRTSVFLARSQSKRVVYVPNLAAFAAAGPLAKDTFTYNVTDGAGHWAVGTVVVQ